MTKKTLILSLIIVVLALAGTALAYFGLRPEPGQNANTNVIPNPPKADEESGEIDTSGWKTYRNEEYGFEFRYPGEYENVIILHDYLRSSDINKKLLYRGFGRIVISLENVLRNICAADGPPGSYSCEDVKILSRTQYGNHIIYIMSTKSYFQPNGTNEKQLITTRNDIYAIDYNQSGKVLFLANITEQVVKGVIGTMKFFKE